MTAGAGVAIRAFHLGIEALASKFMTVLDVQTYAAIEKPAGEQERTISAMAALALRDYLRDRGLLPKDGK